jgi:hypothetical protein
MINDDRTPLNPPVYFKDRSEREELREILGNVLDEKLKPLADELVHLKGAVATVVDRLTVLEKRQDTIEARASVGPFVAYAAMVVALVDLGALVMLAAHGVR